MQLSMRIHIPFPMYLASKDPAPDPKTGLDPTALATPAQWTPEPNYPGDQASFGIAVARAHKVKANASHFVMTSRQSVGYYDAACNTYAGQYDGFEYPGYLTPSLSPLLPVMGCKVNPTLGDSAQVFAEHLWLPGPASNKANAHNSEAKFAKDSFGKLMDYAAGDAPLDAYFIDWSQDGSIKNLFGGGATVPEWVNRGDKVLSAYKSLGIKLMLKVPVPHSMTPGVTALLNKVKQWLGAQCAWCVPFPVGSIVRDQFAAACGGPLIDYFNVTMNGTLVHADGTGSEPAMMPLTFKSQVLTNPSYADRHVMIECGGDSLLVLNQL